MLFDLKTCIHFYINNAHIQIVTITVNYHKCLFRINIFKVSTASDGIGFLRLVTLKLI